jgi:hypothetical protein
MTTVPASTRTTTYTLASASAGPFLVGFRIFDETLIVKVNGVVRADYTVDATFVGGYTDTASITFDDDLAIADVIVIDGDMPVARGAEYLNPDPNLTGKINIEQGRQWAAMQQAVRDIGRLQASLDFIAGYEDNGSGVRAFGAIGDGTFSDQIAFDAALAESAPDGAVYVPPTSAFYVLSSLSVTDARRLYGTGEVRVSGTRRTISTSPYAGTHQARIRVIDSDWQPDQWDISVDGSLYSGGITVQMIRTGGFAGYGGALHADVLVDDDNGLFDAGVTSWVHIRKQTGNNGFGGWIGVGSARPDLGETYTGGINVGLEVNSYSSVDVGLQADVGAAQSNIGIQSVPDAVPRRGAAGRGPVRNGSFAFGAIDSNSGDRWWTAYLNSTDAVAAGGIVQRMRGGSILAMAPSYILLADGYYTNGAVFGGNFIDAISVTGTGTRGLNFSTATLSGSAIRLAQDQLISYGGATINGGVKGLTLSIGAGASAAAADDFIVFGNNFGTKLIHSRFTTVPEIAFNNKTPVAAPTLPAAATDLATVIALANAMRTASINNGLAN